MEEKQMARYFLAGVIGLAVGLNGGLILARHIYRPNSAYVTEFNGDNRPDLVIKNRLGENYVYIQQEDGTYKALTQIQKEQRKSIEAKVKDLK